MHEEQRKHQRRCDACCYCPRSHSKTATQEQNSQRLGCCPAPCNCFAKGRNQYFTYGETEALSHREQRGERPIGSSLHPLVPRGQGRADPYSTSSWGFGFSTKSPKRGGLIQETIPASHITLSGRSPADGSSSWIPGLLAVPHDRQRGPEAGILGWESGHLGSVPTFAAHVGRSRLLSSRFPPFAGQPGSSRGQGHV